MLEEENFITQIDKPKVYLCRPNLNRSTVANFTEAYQVKRVVSKGNIGELSFTLPLFLNDQLRMKKIRNKHVDDIRERFLIRFELGNETEYYIIDRISKIMNDSDTIEVSCYSLGFELSAKLIRDYTVVSYNAKQLLNDILKETIWNVGYMDAQFELKYRSFDLSGTVLDGVNQIAEKFNALIVWDTKLRQINFYDPESYGINKGFKTKMGKLMKGVTQELNMDEFCTRMKLFGKDGLSIQSVNPTGTNFIQDFSYFIYPFKQNSNGDVISHSHYMSDELCIALARYDKVIENKGTEYNNLLKQLETLNGQLSTKNNELTALKTDLALIQDNLDTYNATDKTGLPNNTLINSKNAKQTQINTKNSEISVLTAQINNVNASVQVLHNMFKMENNFSPNQLIELNQFVFEKEINDDNYSDAQTLLDHGKKEFSKVREPKIIVDLSLVNFYEILTEQHNKEKLSIGDVVTVEHEVLGINVKAYATEITYDFESSSIDVLVSNAQDLLTDEDRFMRDHTKSISTSATLDMSKYKWDQAKATADDVSQIFNNTIDTVKRNITAGVNESVDISRRGIIVKDPKDPLKFLIIQHGQIALTSDGGNTWKTAMTPDGVVAERIIGKLLLGNKLIISDNDGTFTIEGNLLTIKDKQGNIRIQLGEYKPGVYGLKIVSKLGTVVLDENGIIQTDTIQLADNVDSTHPLKLKFYIAPSTLVYHQFQLNFTLERFRAYSKGAASGGGGTTTSASGGDTYTTAQSMTINLTTTLPQNVSGSTQTEGSYTGSGGHNHGWPAGTQFKDVSGVTRTWVPSGGHQHAISLQSHSHSINMPSHSHDVYVPSHSHQVNMPSHSHAIDYGIYESTTATGVRIIIDGVTRGGVYSSTENNVDVTAWIQTPGWHTIELSSQQLGRINASLYMKTFVGA
ncbi:phage tail spike protein [Paenibacillus sp. FSL P4-0176]|uniref:phage tail spike protein n=1 Tax=Paenibacillus sp. FSL P4-0176 TaxID=2921631 RepID=UPI0030CDD081